MRFLIASVGLLLASGVFAAGSGNAIERLLNSRAGGSPKTYSEALAEVKRDAEAGRMLQGYVLAVISKDPGAPAEARLDEATRTRYLEAARDKLKNLAETKNNPMAWYLLSAENGDTNLLYRAVLGGNVQALNAWGTMNISRATMMPLSASNEIQRILYESEECFRQAAGKGDANGLYNLGMCNMRGLGIPRNDEAAFTCFRAAAEKGHPEAINNIGGFFREGRVVKKDLETATRWFAKSASYLNAFGQFNYALALQRGEGCKQDYAQAAKLLSEAARGGCIEAMCAYGVALQKGRGVPRDEAAGFLMFVEAARAGFPPAMENLADCYKRGIGTQADIRESTLWKIRSRAARGDANAAAWLRQNGYK